MPLYSCTTLLCSSDGRAQRRPPVPRRHVGATTLLVEEEAYELRASLAASRSERDVLQCELDAMRLELEATRELMAS